MLIAYFFLPTFAAHFFNFKQMKIVHSIAELQKEIVAFRNDKKNIGFVPTMGALHAGHCSLVKQCVAENDVCVVSVFVNPTQFNNADDLLKYPRTLERDAQLLEENGCQLIFSPEPHEIYSEKELNQTFEFDFGGLDAVMEGKFRPGHFNGVVQIVSKLFDLVQPNKAYFGEKDFQQLAIIRRMVKIMNYPIEIIGCPIVREKSGLALSSRNERLSTTEKEIATNIARTLFESRQLKASQSVLQVKNWVIEQINRVEKLHVEYYEIVDADTLQETEKWANAVGCITVFCGEVRLIDNIKY